MKIAILTLPLHINYGGILQAFALQTILRRMGYKTEILNNSYNPSLFRIVLSVIKTMLLHLFGKRRELKVKSIWEQRVMYMRKSQRILSFIENHLSQTKSQLSYVGIKKTINHRFDVVIVGSDQVWRKAYNVSFPLDSWFLGFASDNVKKIAYAASFGIDYSDYTSEEITKCGEAFARMNAVSVREISGLLIIKDIHGWTPKGDCPVVLDPTLLLKAEDYIACFEKLRIGDTEKKHSSKALVYVLDECEFTEPLIESLMPDFDVRQLTSCDVKTDSPLIAPDEWLNEIRTSDIVVTDSFHCCVFSIIFHKPFIIIGNKVRGNARLESLSKLLSLGDRFVNSIEDFRHKRSGLLGGAMDYGMIDSHLEEMREVSRQFLRRNLNN